VEPNIGLAEMKEKEAVVDASTSGFETGDDDGF
jgi:hypothetical protein